ncbi:DYW_deaminase domain-containing protein [Psidium guajava]|nr:DYW_deaminase domain-containing protein [Psidium guajava]
MSFDRDPLYHPPLVSGHCLPPGPPGALSRSVFPPSESSQAARSIGQAWFVGPRSISRSSESRASFRDILTSIMS